MFKGELFGYLTILYLIILATRDSIDAAPIHRGHKRKNEIKPEIASRAVFLDLMPELDKPITNVMEYLTTHGQLSKRKKKQRLHLASQRRRTNKNKQTIKTKSNENLNPNNPNENNSENFEITLATPGALEPRDFINHRMKMNSYMRVWGRYNPQVFGFNDHISF
ncbi:uncharacterized protein Dvir_GJ26379, isoform A [Drosophila virilis]|uniref:Uncharacterized protein, isoform A n=1 Tax=Drosophila virilis TaxID=7244 RepID=A0A0Q9WHG6_DROVI|nr:uncharacterized protein LOC26531149 isoform X2 [Drosophila virilis]KRF81217.1 uncharacterized protein Dvir_GJ26379, isoform A [Drosophila virilis]